MRLNKFIALSTGLSRRAADDAVYRNRVLVSGRPPTPGQQVTTADSVTLDGQVVSPPDHTVTILLHKPVGYVCSREGQGSQTIYDLLPDELHMLKPVGRLDKDSSGLILLTNDGGLAQQLTHPKYEKTKIYDIKLDRPLTANDSQAITTQGVRLPDGVSKLQLEPLTGSNQAAWRVTMHEGRNRQIRRTFEALGYRVSALHRIRFGTYELGKVPAGQYSVV